MKLRTVSALCLAAGSMFAASSAMAWTSADKQWTTSASVSATTDYMWRGASQTLNKPAVQGEFDVSHSSGFYAGMWSSNVDFGSKTSQEIDGYLGYSTSFENGIGIDVSGLRYFYPGEQNIDWNEYIAKLSYSYFTVGAAYSANALGGGDDGTYYSADFNYDLPMGVAFAAGAGYYDLSGSNNDPVDYHIGISKDIAGFGMDLSYIGSNSDAEDLYDPTHTSNITSNRLVFTISKSL